MDVVLINDHQYFISAVALLLMLPLYFADAQIGVCYGQIGNNLPSPAEAVALCNQYHIRRMRIYNPDQATLQALSGSNIEVAVGIPNSDLETIAAGPANANTWVQKNIRNYPNVRFRYIVVGNEVSPLQVTPNYSNFVLPAMRNIYNATHSAGLANQIKVTTAVETSVLQNSYPPANAAFGSNVIGYLNPIIEFLVETGSPFFANVYPYFSYTANKPNIDLSYVLFTSSDGVTVPGGVRYQNLLYTMVDAVYAALEKSNGTSLRIVVSETGWPSGGGDAATLENARTYYTNLIDRVRDGTPKRPGRGIETYLFALFDENMKNPEYQKHFGIFRTTKQPKYPIANYETGETYGFCPQFYSISIPDFPS